MSEVHCYNKGCGQKFDPERNVDGGFTNADFVLLHCISDACRHHPGPAYFHDAYKIWQCCDKKFTDFTAWLEYPGCTRGKHNSEKPAEDIKKLPAQTEIRPEKEDEVIVWKGLNQPAERHTGPAEMVPLKVEVTPGAAAAVERERASTAAKQNGEIAIGAACKNNACKDVSTLQVHVL